MRTEIGTRLKAERERVGLTQVQLAARGGWSKSSVLAWEKGSTMPNAEDLARMSAEGLDVAWVVTGAHEVQESEPQVWGYATSLSERPAPAGLAASPARLTPPERQLLDAYRAAPDPDRAVIERVAALAAQAAR